MWLSEQTARKPEAASGGELGVVTIGGAKSAVEAGSEVRGLPVAGPGGVLWMPERDTEVVTLECGGETVVLGTVGTTPPPGMEPGDVYLSTRNAAIFLKGNGEIILKGKVKIEGGFSVTETGGTADGT